MLQPQSDEEIRPVVEALYRLDPLVGVEWNPRARVLIAGSYSEMGKRIDPVYDGRWRVIRHETPGLHDREFVVLVEVTEYVRVGRRQILMMESQGAYAPIDERLIEYMQTWDAAQRYFTESLDDVWREHEKADSAAQHVRDRAAHQEAAEVVYRKYGGLYWMGGAQGRASPETVQALWPDQRFGKGRRTSDSAPAAAAPAVSATTST